MILLLLCDYVCGHFKLTSFVIQLLIFSGEYSYLSVDVPPLWLAYLGDPSDSGILCNCCI